jgi:hypothetical protein
MKAALRDVAHAAVRRILPPPGSIGDVRLVPMSRDFGLDRGQPIDRRYIAQFLDANRDRIRGVALEVAEPVYANRYRSQLSRVEILHVVPGAEHATIIGDLTKPDTLREGLADVFLATQVLPFIFDVTAAARGCYRVLKPGGTLLATVCSIAQVSRYDMDRWGDYWRFTEASARKLMEQVFDPADIEIASFGNVYAAKAFLDGLAVEDLPDAAALDTHDPDYPVTIGIRATKRS